MLDNRSKSSVEYKHQNISAVLIGMGLPYIDGYKPARNIQKTLPQAVGEYLIRHPEFFEKLADGPVLNPTHVPVIGDRPIEDYFESRPDAIIVPGNDDKPWLSRRGRKIDFARRDAFNRHLGQLGEQFAIEIERQRLISAGTGRSRGQDRMGGSDMRGRRWVRCAVVRPERRHRAVHRGQDDGTGQALPVLHDRERGAMLRGSAGAVPALPRVRFRPESQGLRGIRGRVAGIPTGASRIPRIDLKQATIHRLSRGYGRLGPAVGQTQRVNRTC